MKLRLSYMLSVCDEDGKAVHGMTQFGETSVTPVEIRDDPTHPVWARVGLLIAEDLYQQRQPLPPVEPATTLDQRLHQVIPLSDLHK